MWSLNSAKKDLRGFFDFGWLVLAAQEELEALLWICFTLRCIFSIFEEKKSRKPFSSKKSSDFGRNQITEETQYEKK